MSLSKPEYLSDPRRIRHIVINRETHHTEVLFKNPVVANVLFNGSSDFEPYKPPLKEVKLIEIFMKDIKTKSKHYRINQFIDLTIIEDPFLCGRATMVTVEDKNKDLGHLSVLKCLENEAGLNVLEYGSIVRVVNPLVQQTPIQPAYPLPFMRFCWVEDIRAITVLGKKKDMCRYCGEENAMKMCSKCKRNYCNRECQEADWKYLKHKLICKLPYSST